MTWSDPTTRSTGDLITAAIWNQDAVDNAQYLHDRVLPIWVSNATASLGDYGVDAPSSQFSTYIPDDFDSLSAAYIAVVTDTTTTFNYSINSDYAQPGGGEAYNNHSESLSGQTQAVTANRLYLLDISGILSSLSAGDLLGVTLSKNSGTGAQYTLGMLLLVNLV